MNKFIVNKNEIINGNMDYHCELANDHSTTEGGGLFHVDEKNNKVYFYSKSFEFGPVKYERMVELVKNESYSMQFGGFEFYFSNSESLGDVLINAIKI